MQSLKSFVAADGTKYHIPQDREAEFRADFGEEAQEAKRFRAKDGTHYTIPAADVEAFRADFPDAEETRRVSFADGSTRDFSMPELSRYLRSKEYRESADYKKPEVGSPTWAAIKGFGKEMFNQLGGDASTIRETAAETGNPLYKGYAYAQDLANSFVSGLLGGGSKITEGLGNAIGDNAVGRALVNEGRAGQATLRSALPTDALDTSGNTLLNIGKQVAGVTGEFLPASIPGVGQAYAASVVSAGAVNRAEQVFEAASQNGMSPVVANALALGAGGVDAVQNMLLMGKFKGIWGGETKAAADAAKVGMVRRLLTDSAKTGATMGEGAMLGDVANQIAGIDEEGKVVTPKPFSAKRVLKAGFDGFIEGGMFHLVNSAAHSMPKSVQWVSEAKERSEARQMAIQSYRDALDTPEGRTLVFGNSPEAAYKIFEARRKGGDVSRKMLKALGVPDGVAPTAADRNALGDALMKDYDAYKKWQLKQPDKLQSQALDDTILTFAAETAKETTDAIREKVLGKIEDAKVLDDPEKREKLVGEAFEEWNKEHQQEKPNETGNVPDETSARPQPSVETRAEGSKADRPVEGEPPRGETPRTDVVKPAEKPKEPPQGSQEPPLPPKTGEDTPKPAEGVEGKESTSAANDKPTMGKVEASITGSQGYSMSGAIIDQAHIAGIKKLDSEHDIVEVLSPPAVNNSGTMYVDVVERKNGKLFGGTYYVDTAGDAYHPVERGLKGGTKDHLQEWLETRYTPQEREAKLREWEGKPVEAPSRASDAKPVPDGKGKMVKPKAAESDYGVTMFEEPDVDGDGVWYVVKDGKSDAHRRMYKSREKAEAVLSEERDLRKRITEAPTAKLSDGTTVHLLKTDEGWVPFDEHYNDMRHGLYNASKTKAQAVKVAEKGKAWAKDVTEENKRVPDGKGKMVKPKTQKPKREPQDVTELDKAIEEAKALKKKGGNKVFEVKVGTTTIKFTADDKSIERAEKMSKTLSTVKDWTYKTPTNKVPAAPKPLKVASGNKLAGFDDISKDYTPKGRNSNPRFAKPFVQGGMAYATDGRSMIRMPAEGAADTPDAPDAAKVFGTNRSGKIVEEFKFSPSESHVGLEQASSILGKDGVVEMWRSPTGEIMFRSREGAANAASPSDMSSFVGSSLNGADLIGSYSPEYLTRAFQTLAKLGAKDAEVEWRGPTSALYLKGGGAEILVMPKHSGKVDADTTVQLLGGRRRLTDAERKAALVDEIKAAQERARTEDPEITKERLDEIEKRYRDNEAKVAAKIKESGGKQDPLYSRAPEGDMFEPEAKSPEQEVEERLDLRRIDPKRRSDPKVLAWAKRNGRTITNGMATPDAVRAYDEAMTEGVAKTAKRWFPDMKIFAHKYGEKIKRGVHVIEMSIPQSEYARWNDVLDKYEKGEMTPNSHATVLDNTPAVLKRLGAPNLPVNLSKDIIDKITGIVKTRMGEEHKVPVSELRNLQIELDNPIAVFDSKTRQDSMVVLTRIIDKQNNERAVVALHLDKVRGAINVNDIASMYGKDKNSIGNWTAWGLLRYVNKQARKTSAKWFQLPSDSELRARSILTEKDFSGEELGKIIPDAAAKSKDAPEVNYLRDTSGGVLGWFDPKSKEVHLLPGADPRTVAHEIMWHGTRDYISQLAAKGDARAQRFLDMMHDVEKNIPEPLKKKIIAIYTKGTKAPTSDTLMNEFGAWFTMEKGGKALEDAMTTAEGRNWFVKALYAVKEVYKDFLAKHGGNRVDLSEVDGMTRDEFVDFIAKEFAGGKTLGEITGKANALSTKETKLQAYRRKAYDNNAPVRDLERDIEKKTGKKISADDSVEAANALKYGLKEAANIEIQGKMADFRKALGESGIHYEDLEYYAALKAAAGRDAKIDKRNIDKLTEDMKKAGASAQDIADAIADYKSTNGSHIDPREAKKMLAEIENGPDAAKYKAAYDKLRAVIDETLDTQVAAGLVDAKDAAQWRAEEPYYVPFKNEYDPESGEWNGRGMSRNFAKPENYMAKGRQSAAGDIIAHVFMDHQQAKHRAIENAVRQKLAQLVRANPEIGKVELLRKESVKNIEADDPNVVVFKEGGRAYAIRLNGTRGAAIANAFTQRNLLKMGWADKGFTVFGKKITPRNFAHWSAGMATRYSPTFAIRNTTKDNIELANIVYSERGLVEGSKFLASYAANRAKMAKTLAKYVSTGKLDTATAEGQILDRYIKAGGLIAGGVRSEGMDSIKAKLSPESIAKEMKRGKSKIAAAGKHVANSIAYLNEYAEMATRVGIFSTEVKAGKSDAEAALFSRRATVDFNRHGDWTPGFNLVRLFSNSTLGATARAAAALGKSKYGKAAALAMFGNGLAQAFIEHYYNLDEDERRRKTGEATGKDMSEFDRKTSLFYFRSGDKVYKIAQHESPFSLITYAGNCVGRWLCGDIGGKDVAKNLGVSTAEMAYNFLPMGQINIQSRKGGFVNDLHAAVVSGVCPSVLQPIAELAWNVDFKGDPVLRELANPNDPKSYNGKDHTPEWAKKTVEGLNDATGGNAGRQGFVDIAPEALQKLVEGYGKNALRDVSAAISVWSAIANRDFSGLDPRNTPVKRDFVRPLDGNDRRFNDALSAYNADSHEFSKMKDSWSDEEYRAYVDAHPWVNSKATKKDIDEIAKLRKREKGFIYRNGKAVPYEWSQEEIDKFKKERRERQARVLQDMGR